MSEHNPGGRALPWREPTLLAPLHGVGHALWREELGRLGGIGLVCMEFLRVGRAPIHRGSLLRKVVRTGDLPLSVQLLGAEPAKMARAAGWLADTGAEVVDVNLGCPVRRVVNKGAGAALLRDPDAVYRLLAAMREAVPGLLSAKIRAGFADSRDALAIAEAVQSAGVDFLVVHPRSREAQYSGVADWDLLARITAHLSIPVVGNGDAWYAADVARMMKETGCAAVMIGRPAVRNPWIFAQAAALATGREPPHPDGPQLIDFLRRTAASYGTVFGEFPHQHTGRLKELCKYLSGAVPDGGAFRTDVLRAPDVDTLLARAAHHLERRGRHELDLDAHGALGLARSGAVS